MPPFSEFQVVTSTPDLLVLHEMAYSALGWIGIISAILGAIAGGWKYWRSGLSRGGLIALAVGTGMMFLFGLWTVGLEYTFSFLRSQSAIELQMTWFGRKVSKERLTYTVPPVAEIRTNPKKTYELILRFPDGRFKSLGLATAGPGYEEAARMINQFLQRQSVIQ